MDQTKVTIITACYNGEAYLRDCFYYVLNQSYDKIEFIIVDDGSTDHSRSVMKEYRETFEKRGYEYLILEKENGGAASAVDLALKELTGAYLMLFDVDDVLMKDAVKEKAEYLDRHPEYSMVRNNGYYVRSKKLKQNSYLFVTKKREKENEKIFEDILYARTNNWSGSFMLRCSALFASIDNKSIYVSPWGQNMQLLLPVAYYYKAGFIDKPLMRYVDHGKSVSRDVSPKRQLQLLDGYMENRIEILKQIKMKASDRDEYIKRVQQYYVHVRLKFAQEKGMQELAKQQYRILRQCQDIGFKDRYYYFLAHYPGLAKLHRSCAMLLKALWCVFHKIEGKAVRHDKLC